MPRITDNEAIEAFITGLCYHNDLRDKLLRKRPITVVDLLTTTKKYADADDAKKLLNERIAKAPYSPRRDDYRDNRRRDNFGGRSDIRDRRNDNCDRATTEISTAIAVTTSRASVLAMTMVRSTP
jgi:hypothetical protein